MPKKRPYQVIRVGRVRGSFFLNDAEGGRQFRTLSLQCRLPGKDGESAFFTPSFTLADLANAQAILRLAFDELAKKEAELDLSSIATTSEEDAAEE